MQKIFIYLFFISSTDNKNFKRNKSFKIEYNASYFQKRHVALNEKNYNILHHFFF